MINALRKEFCGKCNFVLLYWGWRFCRHEEFFDGWWNNVQVFVDKKKWNEKKYGKYEEFFRLTMISCTCFLWQIWTSMKFNFGHAKVLPYFIKMFIKHEFRMWMWWYESSNIIPVTWRFLRYTIFYAMC